jgi:hypothetical protein
VNCPRPGLEAMLSCKPAAGFQRSWQLDAIFFGENAVGMREVHTPPA